MKLVQVGGILLVIYVISMLLNEYIWMPVANVEQTTGGFPVSVVFRAVIGFILGWFGGVEIDQILRSRKVSQ